MKIFKVALMNWGKSIPTHLIAVFIAVGGTCIQWYSQGWRAMIEEWHMTVMYIIAPTMGLLFIAYIYHLIRAPLLIKYDGK